MNRENEADKDIFQTFRIEDFSFLAERSILKISELRSKKDSLDIRVNKIKRKKKGFLLFLHFLNNRFYVYSRLGRI